MPRVAVMTPFTCGPLALQPIRIDEPAAHLEGAGRRVVLVLDDDIDAGALALSSGQANCGVGGIAAWTMARGRFKFAKR